VRVLVTDAEYKLTLGAIRSLGRRGVEVVAVAAHPRAEGFHSRYAANRVVGPPPHEGDRFVDFVLETVERKRIDVVLPIGQDSNLALSRARDRVRERAAIAVAAWDSMQVAASKRRAVEFALELGVPVPHTFEDAADVDGFPVVAKKVVGSGQVRYVNYADELPHGDDWLLQEYVPGEGRGLFALLDNGEEKAVFMHRRLREYPVTGGASTAAESIVDPTLRELGLRLLTNLGWHGVAMVEFKLDRRDGSYRLMEINPKFWGSLDLAIAAGVDFPWLAVQLALDRPIVPPSYRVGLRFQWVFSDLVHAAARPRDIPGFLRDLLDPRVREDIMLRDLKPHLAEGRATVADLGRRLRAGTLRHPHGDPARSVSLDRK
jgi:predicted ATP-grasp superfamily ATP-dependent carboligase